MTESIAGGAKKEERKANSFVRRTNTVKKANGLAPVEMTGLASLGAVKKAEWPRIAR
jgi:hypothetical protein